MKSTFTFLFSFLLSSTFLAAQIVPNAGFENWSNPNGYNVPDNWSTLNDATSAAGVYTCTKGTPGFAGAAYIKLTAKTVTGAGVVAGLAISGNLDVTDMSMDAGFPVNVRPVNLVGKWQYMGSGADMGAVGLFLTKWNTITQKRDTLGTIAHILTGMEMSWASFSLPITYTSNDTPDSCLIILGSSGVNPVAGSYLYVDELDLEGNTAGISGAKENPFSLFPNPAKDQITLDLSAMEVANIRVFDLSGKCVLQQQKSAANRHTIDLSSIAPGAYIIQVQSAKGISSARFIHQ
jgi:hypothetical protein